MLAERRAYNFSSPLYALFTRVTNIAGLCCVESYFTRPGMFVVKYLKWVFNFYIFRGLLMISVTVNNIIQRVSFI